MKVIKKVILTMALGLFCLGAEAITEKELIELLNKPGAPKQVAEQYIVPNATKPISPKAAKAIVRDFQLGGRQFAAVRASLIPYFPEIAAPAVERARTPSPVAVDTTTFQQEQADRARRERTAAAITLQSRFRGLLGRREAQRKRKQNAIRDARLAEVQRIGRTAAHARLTREKGANSRDAVRRAMRRWKARKDLGDLPPPPSPPGVPLTAAEQAALDALPLPPPPPSHLIASDADKHAAATRIQAFWKGKKARRAMRKWKAHRDARPPLSEFEKRVEAATRSLIREEDSIKKNLEKARAKLLTAKGLPKTPFKFQRIHRLKEEIEDLEADLEKIPAQRRSAEDTVRHKLESERLQAARATSDAVKDAEEHAITARYNTPERLEDRIKALESQIRKHEIEQKAIQKEKTLFDSQRKALQDKLNTAEADQRKIVVSIQKILASRADAEALRTTLKERRTALKDMLTGSAMSPGAEKAATAKRRSEEESYGSIPYNLRKLNLTLVEIEEQIAHLRSQIARLPKPRRAAPPLKESEKRELALLKRIFDDYKSQGQGNVLAILAGNMKKK